MDACHKRAFLVARWAGASLLAGEGNEHFMFTVRATNSGKAFMQIATLEIGCHRLLDDRSPVAVLGLVPLVVNVLKRVKMLIDQTPQVGGLRIPWAVILLYAPIVERGMSYPDLIQEEGGYWVTETQKTIARMHTIDPVLLEGLWNQVQTRTVAQNGLILSKNLDEPPVSKMKMPQLPSLASGGGFSIEFWLKINSNLAGQIILDSRNKEGKGIVIVTSEQDTIQIDLNDGKNTDRWNCDAGLITTDSWHHVVMIVDGGPKFITMVVDGVLCDGRAQRDFGWSRFSKDLDNVNGSHELTIAPSLEVQLKVVRLYDRYLRTSEAVGNFQADKKKIRAR